MRLFSAITATAAGMRKLTAAILAIACISYAHLVTASDPHPPYRVHVDPSVLKDGTHTNMIAIPGSSLYFGDWELAVDDTITPIDDPGDQVSFTVLVEDKGMIQRRVTDSGGASYIQLILAEEAGSSVDDPANYNNYSGVGAFSESYIKMNDSAGGISSYEGIRCLTSCRDGYINGSLATYFESSVKIQIGSLENSAEKIRIKTLKWDTSTGDPWPVFATPDAGTASGYAEGFTTYSDIWRASYDTGISEGLGTIKEDFTRVALITEDINPYYAYTNEQYFMKVGGSSMNSINSDASSSAKDALAQRIVDANYINPNTGFVITHAEAVNLIEDTMEYTVLEANGQRLAQDGLLVHDTKRTVMQGAVVKAGNIEYINSGEASNPVVSWEDGDRIFRYDVHEATQVGPGVQYLTHVQVENRTTPVDPFASYQSRLNSLYSLDEAVYQAPGSSGSITTNYDPGVGDQFVVEVGDVIDPFNPW